MNSVSLSLFFHVLFLSVTFSLQRPAVAAWSQSGVFSNVAEASEYHLMYSLEIPNSANYSGGVSYNLDLHTNVTSFTRIGYYIELQTSSDTQFVWVSADAFASDTAKIGVPSANLALKYQHLLTNMNVFSSVSAIVTGQNITTGNIEFWPSNYGGNNDIGITNAGGGLDFGDGGAGTGNGYGSMQIHNYGASQVIFAMNNWNNSGSIIDLGIGNSPTGNPDWTFRYNANSYSVKRLQVFALSTTTNAPVITGYVVPTNFTSIVVNFSKALEDAATNLTFFALDGGLSVLNAELDNATKAKITLTTTAQQPYTYYNLTVNGVCDRTSGRTMIATNSTLLFRSMCPSGVYSNVAEASEYLMCYSLEIPNSATYNASGVSYNLDLHTNLPGFSRIAYYIEYQSGTYGTQYVWVSTAAFAGDTAKIGVPCTNLGVKYQHLLTNMNVFSSVSSVVTGQNLTTGNIEFWPSNYGGQNDLGITNASAGAFDFGDGGANTSAGYGSMQIHNYAATQTVFAMNNWGNGTICLGIGSSPSGEPDWTFNANAASYSLKRLQVLVLPTSADPPVISGPVSQTSMTNIVLTFSKPLEEAATNVTFFAINNGLTVLRAELEQLTKTMLTLTTTPHQPSVYYTLTVNGVRDRTSSHVMIATNTTVQYRALTGLIEGRLSGNFDVSNANTGTVIRSGPYMSTTSSKPPWGDNVTWVYSGQIFFTGTNYYTFAENVDDNMRLTIDGVTYIVNGGTWNDVATSGAISNSAGWYDFEARFGNGGGGAGPSGQNTGGAVNWTGTFGFGYNITNYTGLDRNGYVYPQDDGNMNLFRPRAVSVPVISNTSATGITITAAYLNGNLVLDGGAETSLRVYWGTNDAGADVLYWGHTNQLYYKGLTQCRLAGNFNTTGVATGGTTRLGPVMTTTSSKPPWGDNETWVYSGQMYFSGTNYYTFAENIDDNTKLTIGGVTYITNGNAANDVVVSAAISNSAGWYDFDLRVGNGGGGAGPSGQNNPPGAANWTSTFGFGYNATNYNGLDRNGYVYPQDRGDMTLFRCPVGATSGAVTLNVTNLSPVTTYYYRFYATNSAGVCWASSTMSFRTLDPPAPVINNSGGATGVTSTTAWLDGTLVSTGQAPCTVWLYWGPSDGGSNGASWAHAVSLGVNGSASPVTKTTQLTGLTPDTIYYYRYYAVNGYGGRWSDSTAVFSTLLDVTGYPYKMKITFDAYDKPETLTNFPALVALADGTNGFLYQQVASPGGWDLRFMNSSETRMLNYEIEKWDANGSSYVWVQVPALVSGGYIWAYWGNATDTVQQAYTTNGATWSQGFVGVWHMNQTNAVDSTTNHFNGTSYTNANASGRIGLGQSFNGIGAYIDIPDGFADFTGGYSGFTLSVWAYPTITANFARFMDFGNGAGNNNILLTRNTTTANMTLEVFNNTTSGGYNTATNAISNSQWQYFTAKEDIFRAVTLYKDGVTIHQGASTAFPPVVTRTINFIGRSNWGGDAFYAGLLDEMRIENVSRSSNWIWACWLNQVSNSAFAAQGSVVCALPVISNDGGVSNATVNSAVFNGSLISTGAAPTTVRVYWGVTDGGTNTAAWSGWKDFGVVVAAPPAGLSTNVSGLVGGTTYYYRFYAVNSYGEAWASASERFATLMAAIENSAASNITDSSAVLNGNLTAIAVTPTSVDVYWGMTDGGTTNGAWANYASLGPKDVGSLSTAAPGLYEGCTYYYRYFASVFLGLNVRTYDTISGVGYLNPIATLTNATPSGSTTFTGTNRLTYTTFLLPDFPGISANDTLCLLWSGVFYADESSTYSFGTRSDDGSVIYLDLNGDGDYADAGELVVNSNYDQGATNRTGDVNLSKGLYRVAIGYFNGGGGGEMSARWKKGAGISYTNQDPIVGYSTYFWSDFGGGYAWANSTTNFRTRGAPIGLNVRTYDNVTGTGNLNPISMLIGDQPDGTTMFMSNNVLSYTSFVSPYFPGITSEDNLSIMWTGVFVAAENATYSFGTRSDDGSVIYLDRNNDNDFADAGELIVNNNYSQGATSRTGEVALTVGEYRIVIAFFQGTGGKEMGAKWKKGAGVAYDSEDYITGNSIYFLRDFYPFIESAGGPSNITSTSASMSANVVAPPGSSAPAVFLYWGAGNGGVNSNLWANTNSFGTVASGPLSTNLNGLIPNTTYYYRFYVTNSAGELWSRPFNSFTTPFDTNSFPFKMKITFSGYEQAGTLTNFPALVLFNETLTNFSYGSFASPVGGDLRFTDETGTNRLNFEIESWNTGLPVGSPTNISGCALWLRADSGVLTNVGGVVTNWVDQSGMGHDATNYAGSPGLNAVGPNGKPVVNFNGTSYLYTAYNFDPLVQYSIISVARYTGPDTYGRVVSSRDRNWLLGFQSAGDNRFFAEGWIYSGGQNSTNWHIHAGTINNAADPAANYWRDGALLAEGNTGSGNANYMLGRLELGAWTGTNDQSKCEVAEVIIYNRVLTAAELDRIGGYLTRKYGLNAYQTGNSAVWVQIPVFTNNTSIWAYWGGSNTMTLPDYATNGAAWDSNFRSVWHMNETAARDATGRGHNGTPQGAMASGPGQVGAGNDFSSSGYINVPASSNWSFQGDWTWSAWGYTATGGDRSMMGNWGQSIIFALRSSNQMNVALNGLNWRWDIGGVAVPQGSWHLLTCTRAGSTGRFYLDGVQVDSWDASSNNSNGGWTDLRIGSGGASWDNRWKGLLDEMRIEGFGRSSNWLWTCWMNQGSNSSSVTYGSVTGSLPVISVAAGATSITTNSAVLNGSVILEGSSTPDVTIYYGTNDAGVIKANWQYTNSLGAKGVGVFETSASGLLPLMTYYYRVYATNSVGESWTVASTFSTLPVSLWQAGLKYGRLSGSFNISSANPGTGINLGPAMALTAGKPPWGDNETWIYSGQVYFNGTNYCFASHIDDNTRLVIDGVQYIYDTVWNNIDLSGIISNKPAGWYDFELRMGNGGGGAGPSANSGWNINFGFGYNTNSLNTGTQGDYVYPADNGSMNLFRCTFGSFALSNIAPTSVTTNSAVLNGFINIPGSSCRVTLFYGTSDGGTNAVGWQNSVDIGMYRSTESALNYAAAGLSPDTIYYYAFRGTNATETCWAAPSRSFSTPFVSSLYNYRMKITFAGYNKTETLTNFPLLVNISTNNRGFQYDQFNATPGSDLRFLNSNETMALNYEIEKWDTNGQFVCWVQVPQLSSSNDYIWACWGNGSRTVAPGYTTNGSVWSDGFAGVWHLKETNALDSTVNRNHCAGYGVVNAAGLIGTAQSFNGSASYLDVADGFSNFTNSGLTISVWAYPTASPNWPRFVDFGSGASFDNILFARDGTSANLAYNVYNYTAAGGQVTAAGVIVNGQWQYFAAAENTAGTAVLYKNGIQVATGSTAVPRNVSRFNNYIGRSNWGDAYYEGLMDEMRIENVRRSSNWIWACCMNQGGIASFTVAGDVQSTALPMISNLGGITNIMPTSFYANGDLMSTGGAPTTVILYWGVNDGGRVKSSWGNYTYFGQRDEGTLTTNLTGLISCAKYYYRFYASNSFGESWASPSVASDPQSYKMRITFGGYNKAEVLTNFPALMVFTNNMPNFAYDQFYDPDNGGDLRFMNSNETAYLNYEVEEWDSKSSISFITNVPGCILWLRADRGIQTNTVGVTNWVDQSGRANSAWTTNGNEPSYIANGINGNPVVRFDGVNDYLRNTNWLPGFNSSLKMTYFFVSKVAAAVNTSGFFSQRAGGNDWNDWAALDIEQATGAPGGIRYYRNGDPNLLAARDNSVFHIDVLNSDSTGTRVYVDGVRKAGSSAGLGALNPREYAVGARLGPGLTSYGQVDIAEIVIYTNALTVSQVNQVGWYLSQKYGLSTQYKVPGASYVWVQVPELASNTCIWAYWGGADTTPPACTTNGATWSEGYLGVWHLKSTNALDSTTNRLNASDCANNVDVGGEVSLGQSFNGNAYVRSGQALDIANKSFTVSAWVKRASAAADHFIVCHGTATGSQGLHFGFRANNKLTFAFWGNDYDSPGTYPDTSSWHYWVGTFKTGGSRSRRLYLDGADVGGDTPGADYQGLSSTLIRIGERYGDSRFNGIIDEVRISSVSRSSNWVWACYMNIASNSAFVTPVSNYDSDGDGISDTREIFCGTNPYDANSVMRINMMVPTNGVDVSLGYQVGANRTTYLVSSDSPVGSKAPVMTIVSGVSEISGTWTDPGAVNSTARRFYNMAVTYGGTSYTNPVDWALYVQPRVAGRWHMGGVPVDFETAGENNLVSAMGTQLIRGVQQGSEFTGDLMYVMTDTNRSFVKHWVNSSLWYALGAGGPGLTNTIINPMTGFWVQRKGASNTNMVYTGKARTNTVFTVAISNNWNFLQWPFKTDRAENAGWNTANVGWGLKKCGGVGSADPAAADTIMVVQNNSWRRFYLLDGAADATVNGRWWDYNRGGYANFTMQAGQGFYYFHRGSGFSWTNSYGP